MVVERVRADPALRHIQAITAPYEVSLPSRATRLAHESRKRIFMSFVISQPLFRHHTGRRAVDASGAQRRCVLRAERGQRPARLRLSARALRTGKRRQRALVRVGARGQRPGGRRQSQQRAVHAATAGRDRGMR